MTIIKSPNNKGLPANKNHFNIKFNQIERIIFINEGKTKQSATPCCQQMAQKLQVKPEGQEYE